MHYMINAIPFAVVYVVTVLLMLYISKSKVVKQNIPKPNHHILVAREVIVYPNGNKMTLFESKQVYDVLERNKAELHEIQLYHQKLTLAGHRISLDDAARQWIDTCASEWHQHEGSALYTMD